MSKFIIEKDFIDLFPDYKIGVIIANNINNKTSDNTEYQELLNLGCIEAKKYFVEDILSENKVIKVWREAFQKFKTKKGARSSIEALLKRVNKGNNLSSINPLVDIYNYISLKYALPCGGEDIDKFVGNLRLTKADGTESFIALGSDIDDSPYESEIVYKDDYGIVCRCLNWREATRIMLDENTTNAFLCIELIDPSREEEFINSLDELEKLVITKLNASTKKEILDVNNYEIEM